MLILWQHVDVVIDNVTFSAMDDSITFMAPLQMLSVNVNSVEYLGVYGCWHLSV